MARIIYVEDDDLVGDLVKRALSDAGHLVGVIDHGALGYDAIVLKQPDLILLDCSLPGMKGSEILQRVRAIPAIYLMPIVMITALGGEADIDAAMEAGANDYIVKPFDVAELVQRVEAVLANTLFQSRISDRVSRMTMTAVVPVASPHSFS